MLKEPNDMLSMDSTILLPCPFCGSNAMQITNIGTNSDEPTTEEIYCVGCGCKTKSIEVNSIHDDPTSILTKMWNNRQTKDSVNKEILILRAIIARTDLSCIYCHKRKEELIDCGKNCQRKIDIARFAENNNS